MNKKISFTLSFLASLIIIISSASKIIYGHGEKNPIYILTGLYNGHVFILGVGLFLLAFLANNYTRGVLLNALFKSDKSSHDALYKDTENNKIFVITNILIFTLISFYYFLRLDMKRLFIGVDGDYMISIASQQKIWSESAFHFSANFLQGLGGNIWFPLNTLIDLGYILAGASTGLNAPLAYTIWSLLLFASTFFLARAVKLNFTTSMIAAWLAPIFIIYPCPIQLSKLAALIPHLGTLISLSSFLIIAIIVKSRTILSSAARSIFISAALIYFLCHSPTFVILFFPLLAVCGITKLVSLKDRKEFFNEVIIFAIPMILMAGLGAFQFVAGLFFDTAVYVFSKDFLVTPKKLSSIASVFYFPQALGVVCCIFAYMGLISKVITKDKSWEMKILATATLGSCLLLFIFGFIYVYNPNNWDGPSLNYFEFGLWPLYAIFTSCLIIKLLSFLKLASFKLLENDTCKYFVKNSRYMVALVPAIFFLLLGVDTPSERYWSYPPPASPIMNKLDEVAHKPGDVFHGRVATFTGLKIDKPASWIDIQIFDYDVLVDFNNDFRKAGLWENGIPTLAEYNPAISPRFYFFAKRIFEDPGDEQARNMIAMRKISLKHLKMLGINRIITDVPLKKEKLLAQEKSEKHNVYLYSLEKVNLGDWSPTNIVKYSNANDALNYIASEKFNPEKEIFLEKDLQKTPLVKIKESNFIVENSGYKISASSGGVSVILLPVEYSSCFSFEAKTSSSYKPEIIPANFLLTAIIFDKDIEANITYSNGLFKNPGCRLEDYKQFKKILEKEKLN